MGFYNNRVLPHLLNLTMRNVEHEPYRRRVLSQAVGRVLETGIGSGLNLPFYTDRATEIFGLEPHPKLLAMAASKNAVVPAKLMSGSAEEIPLDDGSVDTVVTTWTLCSIPNPVRALKEMRRVLRPGGQLLFVEHGIAPDEKVRRWQRRLNPVWKRISGGCNMDRPISNLIEEAGFRIARVETGYMPGAKTVNFTYEGCANPV